MLIYQNGRVKTNTQRARTKSDWPWYGIYVATCIICRAQGIEQAMVSSSSRWRQNLALWKKKFVITE